MADDGIELFVGLIETVDTPGSVETCRRLLSADERARADRFVFERHQRQYIFAHALLRLALSDVAPNVDPADWSRRACEVAGRSMTEQEWSELLPDRPYHATCAS